MRRLIDDIVAGIKEHFKMKTDKGETEEVTLKEVQTLAKKWSSRCVARACARLQPCNPMCTGRAPVRARVRALLGCSAVWQRLQPRVLRL